MDIHTDPMAARAQSAYHGNGMRQDDENAHSLSGQTPSDMYGHGYSNGQAPDTRPYTSYSDTGFSRSYTAQPADAHPSYQAISPPTETTSPPLYGYQPPKPSSRPSSGMAGQMQRETPPYERQQSYQDQNYRGAPQQQQQQQQPDPATKNTSVVIKVGMVGDAQIGKTSLMVKYVEGSWDEDYIQTLGAHTPYTA